MKYFLMNNIYILALNTYLTPKEIISKIKLGLDESEKRELSSSEVLFKHITKIRRENYVTVNNEDEEIPAEYFKTLDNFKFIHHYMPKGAKDRMIILMNENNMSHLRCSEPSKVVHSIFIKCILFMY
ncbi:hypothetical protein NGRA_2771 [Nosema granulosis]|uniref:Uncharacterized protein n=1 Tax=Nosema granulosis TaxID=83296 RepID=A0A9P6GW17_9MICR|nr:hypothetical protein NGRA_2771 [Nosema granulosis]